MRYFLLVSFLLYGTLSVLAQDTTYFRSDYIEADNSNDYTYYSVESKDATLKDKKVITQYYKSGQLKWTYTLVNGKRIGKGMAYYESGKLLSQDEFENGKLRSVQTFWKLGQLKREEIYKDGVMISGKCYNVLGREIPYFNYELEAQFPGGEEALYKYLSTNIVYPSEAIKQKIEGKVIISFVITKEGTLENIKVKQSVRKDLDDEAIRVIKLMPSWKPSRQDGENCNQAFTLPITFQL